MFASRCCSADRLLESNASRATFDPLEMDAFASIVPREFKLRLANPSGTSMVEVVISDACSTAG